METTQVNNIESLNNIELTEETSDALPTQEMIETATTAMENMQIEEQSNSTQISGQENNNNTDNTDSVSDSEIYFIISRRHSRRRLSQDGGRRIDLCKPRVHCHKGLDYRKKDSSPHRGLGRHGFGPGHREKHGFGPGHREKHGFGPGHREKHGFGPGHRGKHGFGHRGKHGFGAGHCGKFGFRSGHLGRHGMPKIIRIKCDKGAMDTIKLDEIEEMRRIVEIQRSKGYKRHVVKGIHDHCGRRLHRRGLRLRSLSPRGHGSHGK